VVVVLVLNKVTYNSTLFFTPFNFLNVLSTVSQIMPQFKDMKTFFLHKGGNSEHK
jgi:hypothetical protein